MHDVILTHDNYNKNSITNSFTCILTRVSIYIFEKCKLTTQCLYSLVPSVLERISYWSSATAS